MANEEIALVVGVGPGLGAALCRRFVKAGMKVAMGARRGPPLKALADEIRAGRGVTRAYTVDASEEQAVSAVFWSAARRQRSW